MPSPTSVLLRTQTDERLVALVRGGHERAFEAIVERYRRPLLRACRRVLPDARAEDAVQQALMKAWNGLLRGDEVRELRPWLYRIAHNTALNQLRVAGYDYDELHDVITGRDGTTEEFERRLIARSTLAGLAALPERQREALLQIAVHGRGQQEVAQSLGVSEPAVRQLVHRARTQLRSAATALVPMPLAAWAAAAGGRGAPLADRVGELVAGGGAAAGAAAAAKVGTVLVLATGAVASPTVVDRLRHGGHASPPAEARAAAAPRPAPRAAAPASATSRPVLAAAGAGSGAAAGDDGGKRPQRSRARTPAPGGTSGGGDSRRDGGDDDSGRDDPSGDDDSSGDDTSSEGRSRDSDDEPSDDSGDDAASDSRGSGDALPGDDDDNKASSPSTGKGSGSGGHASDDDPPEDPAPAAMPPAVTVPAPDDDDAAEVPEPEHRGDIVNSSEE
jgi:RNA polymerase sigma factor (sigma-70 family)